MNKRKRRKVTTTKKESERKEKSLNTDKGKEHAIHVKKGEGTGGGKESGEVNQDVCFIKSKKELLLWGKKRGTNNDLNATEDEEERIKGELVVGGEKDISGVGEIGTCY